MDRSCSMHYMLSDRKKKLLYKILIRTERVYGYARVRNMPPIMPMQTMRSYFFPFTGPQVQFPFIILVFFGRERDFSNCQRCCTQLFVNTHTHIYLSVVVTLQFKLESLCLQLWYAIGYRIRLYFFFCCVSFESNFLVFIFRPSLYLRSLEVEGLYSKLFLFCSFFLWCGRVDNIKQLCNK